MTGFILFSLCLASTVACRVLLRAPPAVDRETFFDAITTEALEALDPLPPGYDDFPLNLTVAMRLSILSGSEENVAWLLRTHDDTRSLGAGLRFPPELKERALRTTERREMDGDVVAMRGIAMAALDPNLAERLADVFIFANYGETFVDRRCTDEAPPVFNDFGIPDCNTPLILDFIRGRMIGAFEDTQDMIRIVASDPDVHVLGRRGAELSEVDANVQWWPCAYCYETDFCSAQAINCPYEEEPAPPATSPDDAGTQDVT